MKVTLKNLTKEFPSRNKKSPEPVIAVNDFTLEIEDGSLIALLGPSGCGKSTTLNLLSGLQKPTKGEIYFGEDDVTNLPPENRGVGLVFQNYALYPHLTVKQNITFPLENLKGKERLAKDEMLLKAIEVARLVQIDSLLDRKPAELSGGQQQRVAIARALVKEPKVLLLDEPLSNLDARLRLQTREEIRRIQRSTGVTTVFVTHDQDEAMSISDMIVVMKDGVLQQKGRPQEVYDDPCNLFVAKFLGTPPINVFDGEIKNKKLYIGDEAVTDIDAPDGAVDIAIRPEGFTLEGEGVFTCKLDRIEVRGRDISIVSTHPSSQNEVIRAIVDSDNLDTLTGDKVRFGLKPNKVYVFDKTTGERI
ncbi:MAG: ABC transporter ATP-binding protein [Clostridia bacterium]|nr:ABC transporter ATP-binding protein [Clostridia bacterium]